LCQFVGIGEDQIETGFGLPQTNRSQPGRIDDHAARRQRRRFSVDRGVPALVVAARRRVAMTSASASVVH
jgi:hypothetical protein